MRRRLLSRHFPPLGPSQCRHGPCERCCERHACGCALNSASAAVAAGIDRPAAMDVRASVPARAFQQTA